MKCLRRLLPELKLEEEKVPPETLGKLVINMNDFQNAIREIIPSGMREVYLEPPEVRWNDIGGLDSLLLNTTLYHLPTAKGRKKAIIYYFCQCIMRWWRLERNYYIPDRLFPVNPI